VRLSARKAACSPVAPQRSTGNPGSVYTNCETALAVRARKATVKRGKRPLLAVWTKEWLGVVEVISGAQTRRIAKRKRSRSPENTLIAAKRQDGRLNPNQSFDEWNSIYPLNDGEDGASGGQGNQAKPKTENSRGERRLLLTLRKILTILTA
jgi:hypothetical protein